MAGENSPGGNTDTGNTGGNTGGGTPWYQGVEGIDQETVGHWQNKGWDATDPVKVAAAASKAYREAERMIGMRGDHDLLPVPKAADKGDWNAVWSKLGKPATAAEYDFKDIAFKDGTALDDNFTNSIREAAFKANLPKAAAAEMTRAVVNFMESVDAVETAETTAAITAERDGLAKSWGTTADKLALSPHMLAAQSAVRALGVTPEAVTALEKAVGYSKVMEMFRNIATKIGEDKFISNGNPGLNNGVMTREQALLQKSELSKDPAWVKKFLENDQAAAREMRALDQIITSTS